jgi:hypothetical protein
MTATSRRTTTGQLISRAAAAALCVGVAYIHVKDQGGIAVMKDPAYMGLGYWALEATALVVAAMLLTRIRPLATWFLAIGVAAGPLVGFVLTRTVGLPSAMDDRGNWTETLGVESLIVEGVLLVVATAYFLRSRAVSTPAVYDGALPTQRVESSRDSIAA